MSSDEILLKVSGLSKNFNIYQQPADRFKQFVVPRLQRAVGLPVSSYMREFWALRNVSFELRRGETVGIIGRNGSGKSTLLQIVCGTLMPAAGQVVIKGRIAALLELGAGFNPEFSGRDNVFIAGSIAGMSQNEVRDRFAEIEAFAGIGEFIDQPVKFYSSGMYVRLAFAAAIHTEPALLVVDEALAVGDTAFQTKCLTRIRDMQRKGTSILLVTHSTNTLIEYCDRALYLKNGRLQADGFCHEVAKHYAVDLVTEEGGIALPSDPQSVAVSNALVEDTDTIGRASRISIVGVQIYGEDGQQRNDFQLDETFFVRVSLNVDAPVERPCFGIEIKSTNDIVLWTATTQLMQIPLERLEIGKYQLDWKCRANFSGNRYVFAIGAGDQSSGEYRRHSRLAYAGYIDVMPQERCGSGWLVPSADFAICQQK